MGEVDNRVIEAGWVIVIDWLESAMRLLDGKAYECLLMLLWNVWNSRNNLLFTGLLEDPKLVWERALEFGRDFLIFNLNNVAMLPREIHTMS